MHHSDACPLIEWYVASPSLRGKSDGRVASAPHTLPTDASRRCSHSIVLDGLTGSGAVAATVEDTVVEMQHGDIVNLSNFPAELLFELALRSPIRALRCVVRFDPRLVHACDFSAGTDACTCLAARA